MILRTTHNLSFSLIAQSPALAQLAMDYLRAASSVSGYTIDAKTLPNAGTPVTLVQVRLSADEGDEHCLDEFKFRVERLLESLEMVGIDRADPKLLPQQPQEGDACADSAE